MMTSTSDRTFPRTAHPVPGALVACRDERGASILLALFYFLVCAVVGAVVLTAATVTTGQLVALEKSQQAYYSVSSAAELLRDSIQGGTCTMPDPADSTTWTCDLPAQSGANATAVTELETWLKAMVEKVPDPGTGGDMPESAFDLTFVAWSEPVKKSVLDVRATVTMEKDYSLHFTLRPKTYTEPVGDYRITLDIPAALLHGADGTAVERITWERAIIGKPLKAERGAGE